MSNRNSREPALLLLPGSLWQVALAKKIRDLNYTLYVVDPNSDAPCFQYADEHLQADIFDIEAIDGFVEQHPISGILSDECDIATVLIAELAERYGLPSIGVDISKLYSDKYLMRQFCSKYSIPTPNYQLCFTAEDAKQFLRKEERPIIIKPLDSNSSHGVFMIISESQIDDWFEESLSFSRTQKAVLAETYIEGTEFTIDGIKTPENHFTLAISEKKHFKHNPNIASDLYFSQVNDEYDYGQLTAINDHFVKASDLPYGLTHAEYKYNDGKFYLIEIGARGGGNMISSHIAPYISGHDTYKYLIECSVGAAEEEDFSIDDSLKSRVALLHFFDTPKKGGLVKAVQGLSILEQDPSVIASQLRFNVGDIIKKCDSDAARIGFYIGCCENAAELETLITKIDTEFKVLVES